MSSEAESFDPSQFAVLVVDDEEMNRDMLSRRLERKGYFTMTAEGGLEAIEKINGAGCDIVLLDIMMPGVSGIDTLKMIRERLSAQSLPVIMASARTDTEAITTCLQAGANDYVTKPLDFPVVLARVQTQLMMKGAVEAMRASERRFKALADASADMISMHGPDGRFRFASAASRLMLGYEPVALEGKTLEELMHPDDREQLPKVADLPEACTIVARLQKSDGTFAWAEIRTRLLKGNRTGKITDLTCTTRDVSNTMTRRAQAPLVTATDASGATVAPVVALDSVAPVVDDAPPVRRKR